MESLRGVSALFPQGSCFVKISFGSRPGFSDFVSDCGIQGLKAGGFSSFGWAAGLDFFLAPFCLGLAVPAFMLPFFYQFGTGKGRLVYIGIICLLTCLVYSAQQVGADGKVLGAGFSLPVNIRLAKAAVTLICFVLSSLASLSWGISVFIYSRKELS